MDELIEQSLAWVKENYGKRAEHLLKAEEWLRRIHLAPSQAMLLATLTHDMERAFPGSKVSPAKAVGEPGLTHRRKSAGPWYTKTPGQCGGTLGRRGRLVAIGASDACEANYSEVRAGAASECPLFFGLCALRAAGHNCYGPGRAKATDSSMI